MWRDKIKSSINKVLGEEPFERYLMLTSIVSFLAFIISIGIWVLIDRPYNKFTTGILFALAFAMATLGMRLSLIEEKDRAKSLAEINYEKWKVSYQEALDYFIAQAEKKIFKEWFIVTLLLLVISGLIMVFWPF